MKDLLTELVNIGRLEPFGEEDGHLAYLLRAVWLLRRGAIQAASHDLRRVARWGGRDLTLLKDCLETDL